MFAKVLWEIVIKTLDHKRFCEGFGGTYPALHAQHDGSSPDVCVVTVRYDGLQYDVSSPDVCVGISYARLCFRSQIIHPDHGGVGFRFRATGEHCH